MKGYRFLKREEELNIIHSNFYNKRILLLNANNRSGLTCFLKKICTNLCERKKLCFYIDGEEKRSFAEQVLFQVFSSVSYSDLEEKLKKHPKKDIIKAVIKMVLYPLDMIPVPSNIGSTIANILDCIEQTIDVDIDHISDYKYEKALHELFRSVNDEIYFIVDNPAQLSRESYNYISKIMVRFDIRMVIAFPKCTYEKKMEIISKFLPNAFSETKEIEKYFDRPDDSLIRALFDYYEKDFEDNYISFFEKYDRNIHVIMSFINGFDMNISRIREEELYILKIMMIIDSKISIDILLQIFRKKNLNYEECTNSQFNLFCNSLCQYGFINIHNLNILSLNKNFINELVIDISFVERQIIIQNCIEVFSNCDITEDHCKFAIENLSKDYSKRKYFILKLIRLQDMHSEIDSRYLDMIFAPEDKKELITLCSLYYNLHIFDAPYLRLQQYNQYKGDRQYDILIALVMERLHLDDYPQKIEELVNLSVNKEEQCLLLSVLFVAYLNTNNDNKRNEILCNESSRYYYKNYSDTKVFPYLLRNISYYITDIQESIKNFDYCLHTFKSSDPVNYNRTMSNFICYLMKYDENYMAKQILDSKMVEINKILTFNDSKYSYLNVNYGLYLMKYNRGNPEDYFKSIVYSSGTTETPYIYAQINLAIYILKSNPLRAMEILNILEYHIKKTTVIMTRQFYNINRCLVEYANGIKNYKLIDQLKGQTFRGDPNYMTKLYSIYKERFDNEVPYTLQDWYELYCPGYLFYRYFDIRMLFE